MEIAEIERRFSAHDVDPDGLVTIEIMRTKFKSIALMLDAAVPDSRDKGAALTALEEASFWVIAALARNEA